MKTTKTLASLFSVLLFSGVASAESFTLSSSDIAHGEFMGKAQVFQGFGCDGDNISPQLSWSNAPKGTQAYAVIAYDPDAPTGSGWWHWQVVNIPKNVTSLASGAGAASGKQLPKGAFHIENDYSFSGFGGACPPVGDGAHRYQFTVHALSKELSLPENPSSALVGYMINAHSLGSSTIESLYKR